ncbi:hypothetical protein [Georhizobium sp. MAB10]|uniref:hypothetical protein n=1 Tax=Georhizobium sp. MAB10 TaxID=3028319 RepID=UPI0038559573
MLTGCFEFEQHFEFEADGNAAATGKIVMDAAVVAMTERDGKPFCDEEVVATGEVEKTVTKSTVEADLVCTIEMTGEMQQVIQAVAEAATTTAEDPPTAMLSDDNGRFTLTIHLPSLKEDEPPSEQDEEMAEMMQQMFLARLSGRVLRFSVTAPEIIETNGTISDDGTVATLTRPMADAFTSDEPTIFRTVFELGDSGALERVRGLFRSDEEVE